MTGIDLDADPSDPHNGMGIIPRSVSNIFQRAKQMKEKRGVGWSCSIKGSFIEIYNEGLIDLLGEESVKREVQIRDDKDCHIISGGLREVTVRNAGEVMNLLRQGTSIRHTNETEMNAQSSRSHAIFSLTLTQKKYTGSGPPPRSSSPLPPTGRSPSRLARPGSVYNGSTAQRVSSPTFGRPLTPSFHTAMRRSSGLRPAGAMGDRISPAPGKAHDEEVGEWVTMVSKFHFVDLAGSERLKRTAAVGERIEEGISIDSGLLALGNVISALGDPARVESHTASHIPYQDSKLTRLLQDSLGGNAHTLMIACVSPAEWNVGETVNTLKYAIRARNIRNRAVVNEKEDGWDGVEWLQNRVTQLPNKLKGIKDGTSIGRGLISVNSDHEMDDASRLMPQQFVDLQSQHDELRQRFTQRTEGLTRLRRELGESQRAGGGSIPDTGQYEEIVGPMEAELSPNRVALRYTNDMVTEKAAELSAVTQRHWETEPHLEWPGWEKWFERQNAVNAQMNIHTDQKRTSRPCS
ncbi:P-loop containing nucleoside triphosphate hydrolase protein [Gautieria morchelliformis]|nr:P-loop containing nucleoside triphosphate hydrolase protein [Gautieria morchelliformis]